MAGWLTRSLRREKLIESCLPEKPNSFWGSSPPHPRRKGASRLLPSHSTFDRNVNNLDNESGIILQLNQLKCCELFLTVAPSALTEMLEFADFRHGERVKSGATLVEFS
jgi:hypothetical protein